VSASRALEARSSRLVWLPNAFTAMNVLLGFLSILVSVNASLRPESALPGEPTAYDTAAWLIAWAAIFDVIDGKVAKLTGTSSDFGMRLDTFADATTFGLAPAVLIFCTFLSPARIAEPWGWVACGCYFMAAIFRLARYNVQSAASPGFGFVGVPTPTAALITVPLYLHLHDAEPPVWAVAALMVLTALFMVSPIRYPALKGLYPREKKVILALLIAAAIVTAFFGPAMALLFFFGTFAFVWGPLWVPTRRFWVPELQPPLKKRKT
jgi:CDP-diacylglycerol--serine O-phosphatidyltransferase